jgi:hypothetical protein
MSKTDKTRPVWVKEHDSTYDYFFIRHDHRFGVCIVETPDHHRRGAPVRPDGTVTCRVWCRLGYEVAVCVVYGSPPPQDFRAVWERSARRDKRDTLRAAAREYNTHHDTDAEPLPVRHRHTARRHWG